MLDLSINEDNRTQPTWLHISAGVFEAFHFDAYSDQALTYARDVMIQTRLNPSSKT